MAKDLDKKNMEESKPEASIDPSQFTSLESSDISSISIIDRLISPVKAFLDRINKTDYQANSLVGQADESPYRSVPKWNVTTAPDFFLERLSLKRVFISANPQLHLSLKNLASQIKLKSVRNYGLQFANDYENITNFKPEFDLSVWPDLIESIIDSEYLLKDHQYLIESPSVGSNLDEQAGQLLTTLLDLLSERNAVYFFPPIIKRTHRLSKFDFDEYFSGYEKEKFFARLGMGPNLSLFLLPFTAVLSSPSSFVQKESTDFDLVEAYPGQSSSESLVVRVADRKIILKRNCYFGERKHTISGRVSCSKNHFLGRVRMVIGS